QPLPHVRLVDLQLARSPRIVTRRFAGARPRAPFESSQRNGTASIRQVAGAVGVVLARCLFSVRTNSGGGDASLNDGKITGHAIPTDIEWIRLARLSVGGGVSLKVGVVELGVIRDQSSGAIICSGLRHLPG